MSDSVIGRTIFTVFKVSLLLISLTLFGIAYFFNQDNLEQDNWVETKAKIFKSDVIKKEVRIAGRKAVSYDLDVAYGYIVNNKRYNQIGLFAYNKTPKTLSREYFIDQAKVYSKNKIVKTYYNPENPKESYLVLNKGSSAYVFYSAISKLLIVSLLLFLIQPILGLLENYRLRKELSKEHKFIIPDDVKRVQPIRRHR